MQNSNSPSGYEQFMESLSEMSQQQQGLNQGTFQLSQLGLMSQQNLLGELQSQQEKLKEQLNNLLEQFPGENSGTMEKISKDMDEVIQDFKNKNINRETIERQNQILSRMLDSQKSLTKKDFSDQRKRKVGQQFEYLGEDGLPSDLGDKNLLLINAMESAMEEEYSNEYNNIIRNYFIKLQNEE